MSLGLSNLARTYMRGSSTLRYLLRAICKSDSRGLYFDSAKMLATISGRTSHLPAMLGAQGAHD